jgi:hypothetical protein
MELVKTLSVKDIHHNSIACHFDECRDYLNVMLSVIMLNVVMLSVVMLSVVPPKLISVNNARVYLRIATCDVPLSFYAPILTLKC